MWTEWCEVDGKRVQCSAGYLSRMSKCMWRHQDQLEAQRSQGSGCLAWQTAGETVTHEAAELEGAADIPQVAHHQAVALCATRTHCSVPCQYDEQRSGCQQCVRRWAAFKR